MVRLPKDRVFSVYFSTTLKKISYFQKFQIIFLINSAHNFRTGYPHAGVRVDIIYPHAGACGQPIYEIYLSARRFFFKKNQIKYELIKKFYFQIEIHIYISKSFLTNISKVKKSKIKSACGQTIYEIYLSTRRQTPMYYIWEKICV